MLLGKKKLNEFEEARRQVEAIVQQRDVKIAKLETLVADLEVLF